MRANLNRCHTSPMWAFPSVVIDPAGDHISAAPYLRHRIKFNNANVCTRYNA